MPKRAESHRCEVNTLGILACSFSLFCKVSQNGLQNLNSVTYFSQKISKNNRTC